MYYDYYYYLFKILVVVLVLLMHSYSIDIIHHFQAELYTHESRILNSHDLEVSLQPAPGSHCRLQVIIVNIGHSNAERVCTF